MPHEKRNELINNFVSTSLELQNNVSFNIKPSFSYTFAQIVDTKKISTELFGEESADDLDHLGAQITGLKMSIEGGQGLLYLYANNHPELVDLDISMFDMSDWSDIAICIRSLVAFDF